MSSPSLRPETGIRALLSNRRYTLYLVSRLSLIVAAQALSVAVGWQIYEITGEALALGLSGLSLFLPGFLLAIAGGHVADQHDRRLILQICHLGFGACAAALAVLAARGEKATLPIYGVLVVIGAIRAFSGPAGQALMPNLVERHQLERAVALGSSTWQFAMIAGPSIGGVLYAATGKASTVYVLCVAMAVAAFASVFAMGPGPDRARAARPTGRASWKTLLAGVGYVWSDKAILGAVSLDLFAVLLGGAVALLPIYARDLLGIGPWGLGILRSAPAVGAALTALALAWSPLQKRAGATMFAGVFVFGVATVVFGVSTSFTLSLAALVVIGASDMFSVVVRSTLIQLRTPDEMRGRVGAVNMVFIGASNELGEFRAGASAAWFGPEAAVIIGGVGTCLIVVAWALLFPELRRVDRLR